MILTSRAFFQNKYSAKEKLDLIGITLSEFDIVCILTICYYQQIALIFFLVILVITYNLPRVLGVARLLIVIRNKFRSTLIEPSDFFPVVDLEKFFIIHVYLPRNYRNFRPDLAKIRVSNKLILAMGDFNTDLTDLSLPRSEILLSSLPSDLFIMDKTQSFSYTHFSGSVSNRFCIDQYI
jgi:hypothetical protein